MTSETYRTCSRPAARHAFKNVARARPRDVDGRHGLAAVAAWVVVRTKLRGRALIDNLAFSRSSSPASCSASRCSSIYLRTSWLPVYGTLWILFIAYLTRFMPYGMRYASTSMFQIGRELEESAAMSGAGWFATFRRVVLPLLVPGLVAGWIYIVIVSVRELGELGAALLAGPRGAVDRDLGAIATERPYVGRARRAADRRARRARRASPTSSAPGSASGRT